MASDTRKYYGGTSVTGKVWQLTASCFKELVGSYFNIPIVKPFTRSDFASYDPDAQMKYKDGPFVCPAYFTGDGSPVARNTANAVGVNLAIMDFDSLSKKDVAEGFVDYAAEIHADPEGFRSLLHPLNCVIYETASSREGNRRVRVVVDVAGLPVADYPRTVLSIAHILEIDPARWKGRPESLKVSQPMYRPVQYLEEEFTAVLATRTDGKAFEALDLRSESEVGDAEGRSYGYTPSGDVDDLDMRNLPLAGVTIATVAKALGHLDPDMTRPQWVKVGMAMRHQFRGEEEAREAFDQFDAWSSEGDKYAGQEETLKKWLSFKPDAAGRDSTTIASLFEMAKEAGWDPSELTAKVKTDLAEWIKRCNDPDRLMADGPGRIALLPFKNALVEEVLCSSLIERIKSLSGQSITKSSLTKAIRTFKQQKSAKEDDDLAPWARPWTFIRTRNTFRNVTTGVELSTDAFNNAHSHHLMGVGEESLATGKPAVRPQDYLLNLKKIRQVDGTTYDPTQEGAEPFFTANGLVYLNEFRQSTIPRLDPKNAPTAGKWFTELVEQVVGREFTPLILDFFAHTIQFPGIVIRWAPLIQSAEGAGKNVMCNAVGYALGIELANFKTISAKSIISDYNEWCSGAQLIVLDEIKLPGHSKADLMNRLKDMITNDTVTISEKFKNTAIARNVANKIAFTNYRDALHMEETDRRWMPIKSPVQTQAEQEKLVREGRFDKFAKLYKYGGALRQFFLDRVISPDFPTNGPAPKTAFRAEMVLESKNRLQEEIEDLIENPACPLIREDVIFSPALTTRLRETKDNHKPSYYLRRMGYELHGGGTRFYLGEERGTVWVHRDNHDSDMGDPVAILKERMEKETDF